MIVLEKNRWNCRKNIYIN